MKFRLPIIKNHSLSKVKYEHLLNEHDKTFCSECGKSLNVVDHLSKGRRFIYACIAFALGASLMMGTIIYSKRRVSEESSDIQYAAKELFGKSRFADFILFTLPRLDCNTRFLLLQSYSYITTDLFS